MSNYRLPEIREVRAIKSQREVGYITKAQRISELVLKEAVSTLKVGVSEIALARFIVSRFKFHRTNVLAFEPIVAFGKSTADVHHEPGKARLKRGHTVMLDFGCTVEGYCSDMTRTFFFGQPTAKQKRVYAAVLSAQQSVLQALAKGERRTGTLDALARRPLTKKFGSHSFPHGLGHGLGTVIHEWPSFKPRSRDVLKPGMVMTVEPGVYLKHWGGIRIEDMVVITARGCRNLTKVPKSLQQAVLKV